MAHQAVMKTMKAMQIFELKSVEIDGNKSLDGSYKTVESQLGIFDSRQNAEAFMKIVIKNEKSYSRFFAFFIYEKTQNYKSKHTKKCNY